MFLIIAHQCFYCVADRRLHFRCSIKFSKTSVSSCRRLWRRRSTPPHHHGRNWVPNHWLWLQHRRRIRSHRHCNTEHPCPVTSEPCNTPLRPQIGAPTHWHWHWNRNLEQFYQKMGHILPWVEHRWQVSPSSVASMCERLIMRHDAQIRPWHRY